MSTVLRKLMLWSGAAALLLTGFGSGAAHAVAAKSVPDK
jgi:hypothetical protein